MNFILFASLIPKLKCNQNLTIIPNSTSKPLLTKLSFEILLLIDGALIFYLFCYFIAQFYLCKPKKGKLPSITQIVFNIISAVLIIIGCVIIACAIPKFIIKVNDSDEYNSFKLDLKNTINQNDNQIMKKFSTNYTEFSYYFNLSLSLRNIVQDYEFEFSNKNSEYRHFYDKLYLKAKENSDLKKCLDGMEKSRQLFISTIFSFSQNNDNFIYWIESMFNSSKEKNYLLLDTNISTDYSDEQNKRFNNFRSIKTYNNSVNVIFAYIFVGLSIFAAISYCVIFFFNTENAILLYKGFPISAGILLLISFVSRLILLANSYEDLQKDCSYNEAKILNIESKKNFGVDEKHSFIGVHFNHIQNIYQNMSSNIIHANFSLLYSKYSKNEKYKKYLDNMASVIRHKEKELKTIRILLKEINDRVLSIFQRFKFADLKPLTCNSNSISIKEASSPISCDSLFLAFTLCFTGLLMFLVGLLIMSIIICIRRVNMLYVSRVENYQMKKYYFGVKRMYLAIVITENCTTIELKQSGFWGDGFYFYETEEYSIEQTMILANEQNTPYYAVIIVTCEIDFGYILEVPQNSSKGFHYPDTLIEYDCSSVMGYNNHDIKQYVMYSNEKIQIKKIEKFIPSNQTRSVIQSYE